MANIKGRIPNYLSFVLAASLSAGCSGSNCVTVVLSSVNDQATFDAVYTILPTMLDHRKGSYSLSCWKRSDEVWPERITVSPVEDPAEWSRGIQFGHVEKIGGRTIYVRVKPESAKVQAQLIKTVVFFRDLPKTVHKLAFVCRVKVLAWWAQEPEDDVACELFLRDLRTASTIK